MPSKYTEQQVAEALAALELNQGNLKRTARELALPHATLRFWRDEALKAGTDQALSPLVPEKRDFAKLWADAQERLVQRIIDLAPTGSLRDVAIAAGIAADKHLDYDLGRKGTQVNVDARQQTVNVHVDDVIRGIIQARSSLSLQAGPEEPTP